MKIERIKTKINTRKVYVPPMALFEDIEEEILAGSIPGKGNNTDTGGGVEEPGRGNRAATTSFFEDPIALEDYSLDVENYN